MLAANRFVRVRKIGTGGFGIVWLCRRRADGAEFAMKELNPDADSEAIRRFTREVRILSSLDHPSIIRVHSKHLKEPSYWYTMPLYQRSLAEDLPSLVGQKHRIQAISERILDGLEYAHAQGVIHRDLKPQNILMNSDSDVVISDFGLGRQFDAISIRQTQTGYGLGTPMYMAPEQSNDAKNADQRSDIFSFGRILHELFAGPLTFAPLDLSSLPATFALIIERCTQSDPAQRYQSIAELKTALRLLSDAATEASLSEELEHLLVDLSSSRKVQSHDVGRLGELLAARCDDPDLAHKVVMSTPSRVLEVLWQVNRDVASATFRTFVEMAAIQSWPFDYTDSIASKCKELLVFVNDPALRAAIIWCVVVVGVDHNRWRVIGIAASMLTSLQDPNEARLVVGRLQNLRRGQIETLAEYVELKNLNPLIKIVFK